MRAGAGARASPGSAREASAGARLDDSQALRESGDREPRGARVAGRLLPPQREIETPGHADLARRSRSRLRRPVGGRPRAVVDAACRHQRRPVTRPTVPSTPQTVEVAFVKNGWVVRVDRTVPRRTSAAEFALRELTQGPTKVERRRGHPNGAARGRAAPLAPARRRQLARELLPVDVRPRLGGHEADAPVADRGHARSARGRGVGGGRRGGSLPDERPARGSPRRLERRERRAGLPLLAPRDPAAPRGARLPERLRRHRLGRLPHGAGAARVPGLGGPRPHGDRDRPDAGRALQGVTSTSGGATSGRRIEIYRDKGVLLMAEHGEVVAPSTRPRARSGGRRPATSTCTRSRSIRGPSPSTCGCRTRRTSAAGSRCTSRRTSRRIRPRTAASGCPTARPTASTASWTSARPSSCADHPGGERGHDDAAARRPPSGSARSEIPR